MAILLLIRIPPWTIGPGCQPSFSTAQEFMDSMATISLSQAILFLMMWMSHVKPVFFKKKKKLWAAVAWSGCEGHYHLSYVSDLLLLPLSIELNSFKWYALAIGFPRDTGWTTNNLADETAWFTIGKKHYLRLLTWSPQSGPLVFLRSFSRWSYRNNVWVMDRF